MYDGLGGIEFGLALLFYAITTLGTLLCILYFVFRYFIKRYLATKKKKDKKATRVNLLAIVAAIVAVIGILCTLGGVNIYRSIEHNNKLDDYLRNRTFEVYGIPGQELDTSHLRIPGYRTVPHLESQLQTEDGVILILQSEADEVVNKMFVPEQELCNARHLSSHIGGNEQREPDTVTQDKCPKVKPASGGVEFFKGGIVDRWSGELLYFASIKDTVIMFRVYLSGVNLAFDGSEDEVEQHIEKFLKEARPLSDEELLN